MHYTGIVQEVGTVTSYEHKENYSLWEGETDKGVLMSVSCEHAAHAAVVGTHISVNGTRLPITQVSATSIEVAIPPARLPLTNLGTVSVGDQVNLERPCTTHEDALAKVNHPVVWKARVDGLGSVAYKQQDGEGLRITIKTTAELARSIILKGYVAVDGISLVVCDIEPESHQFAVMLGQHSIHAVSLTNKPVGAVVNIEVPETGHGLGHHTRDSVTLSHGETVEHNTN
eukprot:m.256122 g.256122  ORF g.256122 m.256122 type:complete len:229 (-) comp34071_c0_seq1:160-846(-)